MEVMPGSPLPALAETDPLPAAGRLPLPVLARATCKVVYTQSSVLITACSFLSSRVTAQRLPRWALDRQLPGSASSSGSTRAGAGRHCL